MSTRTRSRRFPSLEPHKVYKVMGGIQLFDLNEELHLHIESACDTLSGYLIEQLGYIPSCRRICR